MPGQVNTEQVHTMLNRNENILLINVLDKDKFDQAHIPSSVNVPLKSPEFLKQVSRLVSDIDQKIVVYCAGNECEASATAAQRLEDAGYQNVYQFKGGIEEWREAGHTLEHIAQKGTTFAPTERSGSQPPTIIR